MRLVVDCESNGLLEELDTIHCLVIRDYVSDEVVASCADQPGYKPISHGLSLLSEAEKIFAHNGIAFDIPALKKVYPRWEYRGDIFDTLVAARTRWAHIKSTDFALIKNGKMPGMFLGSHKLAAWGYRMGIHKGEYSGGWETWTPEMQVYCERDTLVTRELLLRLKQAGWSKQATDMEMELAWMLAAMERGGWPLNVEKAQALQAVLSAKREAAAQTLRDTFGEFYQRNGPTKKPKKDRRICIDTFVDPKGRERKVMETVFFEGAEYQPLKIVDFNPGSRNHIADRLIKLHGWEPVEYNENDGKPKINEGILLSLPYPEIPDICSYLQLDKRLGQLSEGEEAILNHVTDQRSQGGRITGMQHVHGYINAGGTVTHRCSHSKPNVGQTPKVKSPWGKEFRELYMVPPGWELVGSDASGLELRCLAHYMARWDDMAYGRIILEGDIHAVNQRVLELPDEPVDGQKTGGRDTGKTWFYAYLYGAGDEKLGSIVAPAFSPERQAKRGKADRKRFEGGLPALGYLVEALKEKASTQGWISLIDGRRAYVRHEHAVLNTLLQGTGGVICKHWGVESNRRIVQKLGPMGWDKQWFRCGFIHDEYQDASRPEHSQFIAETMISSAQYMTEKFSFRCPLTGEAKIGKDWASTH